MRTPQDMPRRLPRTSRRFRIGVAVAVVVLILLIVSLRTLAGFWTDYLWFREVHFTSVFRGVLVNEVVLAVIFIAALFGLLLANLTIADRLAPVLPTGPEDEFTARYRAFVGHRAVWVRVGLALFFGFLGGVEARGQWNNWVLFLNRTNFTGPSSTDPLNHYNAAFYVFQLPFIKFVLGWLFAAFVLVTILTALAHYLNGGISFQAAPERVTRQVKTHLSVLLAILALIKAAQYYLERIELVLNRKYVVNGATYTVVHAERPALIILIVAALFAVALFLYNTREKGWLLPGVAVGVWVVVYLLVGVAYPAFIQAARVKPSELTRERPYIQDNIAATRYAYSFDNVQTLPTNVSTGQVSASEVTPGAGSVANANYQALTNVRLLDPDYIQNAFNKNQELRQYFAFPALNVDRYDLNGQLTQTLIAVRELNESGVPGGFVNQKLAYTHGYGAAIAAANQQGVNADGTVDYALSGLPPATSGQGMQSINMSQPGSQPRIYYGESSSTGGFVIAGSKQKELDYQAANGSQVQSSYTGTGGVDAGSLVRRAAFALRFADLDFLLSGQITPKSKVMYYRNINTRVHKAAPFLRFDNNPYAVVLNGHVYWIIDAYTTTDDYPYAQQADTSRLSGGTSTLAGTRFNYVRNSVKVVVDAYNGSMKFFVVDPNDPVIRAYEKAFPDLFTPVSQADKDFPGITAHWRYPEDLFTVQTNMFGRYHLTDVTQFYTQDNAWNVAQNPGSGTPGQQTQVGVPQVQPNGQVVPVSVPRFTPTYLLTHLPNQTQLQFLILEPFVPVSQSDKQQNLTGILTAESDPQGVGSLEVYTTPPGINVDGPLQAGAAISTNTKISSEISLLNQQGSKVQLGNLVVVLLGDTLMYVEPLYVESSINSIPQLRDVIVVYNGTAYNSQNASLDAALCQITNSDGTKPFAYYCNTSAAGRQQLNLNGGTSSSTSPGTGNTGAGSTTTTTAPSSTTTTTTAPPASAAPAPANASASQLISQAQQDLNQANAALHNGNLGQYQTLVNQANQLLGQAQQKQSSSTTSPASPPASG